LQSDLKAFIIDSLFMNEIIFASHLAAILVISYITRRLGLVALTCFVVLQSLLANLFVLKQIVLFGYEVTCSDVFSVGAIVALNLLQEDFDAAASRRAVLLSFFFMIFFVLMSWIHLLYAPSGQDYMHSAYSQILSFAPRLMFASICTTVIAQGVDVRLFSSMKMLAPKASLFFRSGITVFISQGLDTLLFTFLGLYGLVASPWNIFFISYAIKMFISLFLLLFSSHAFSIRSTSSV